MFALSSSLRSGNLRRQIGRDVRYAQASHELRQVKCVRTDVTDGAGHAGPLGIGAPAGLLVAFRFELRRQPALRILNLYDPKFPELAARDHLARLSHEGIAAVVVGDGENLLRAIGDVDQVLRFSDLVGEWLVADDMKSCVETAPRGRVVQVVGRHDCNDVDTIGATCFRRE